MFDGAQINYFLYIYKYFFEVDARADGFVYNRKSRNSDIIFFFIEKYSFFRKFTFSFVFCALKKR